MVTNSRRELFKGEVCLVNPHHKQILGQKCYPSVSAIPGNVETIVVAIPGTNVPEVVEEAGKAGTKAAIIISSGFAEIGNRALERQLLERARKYDVALVGPNCLGVYDSLTGMDTLFLPETKFLSDGRSRSNAPPETWINIPPDTKWSLRSCSPRLHGRALDGNPSFR